MRELRREDYIEGRFTLSFVGYGPESTAPALELTHNWDSAGYELGNAFGHVAIAVGDLWATCQALAEHGVEILRPPGPMAFAADTSDARDVIAFVQDPDGYRIELIEAR